MSGLRDDDDFDGCDAGGTQCPPNADHTIDRHSQHDHDEKTRERRVNIVVEDDPVHLLDGFGRSEDFAGRQRLTKSSGVADEADCRRRAEHLFEPAVSVQTSNQTVGTIVTHA